MEDRYLYKGQRIDTKEWVKGDLSFNHSIYANPTIKYDIAFDVVEVIPETVGQCTGLKDKNGDLIFEGDILDENGYDFTVVYDQQWAKFKLQHGDVYQYPEWNRGVNMVIVGNAHDPQGAERGTE